MVLLEKRCEPRKTVGIARAAPIGADGRFALGRISTGCREGFLSFRRTLPAASKLEEALLEVSHRLIEAQELERNRIARELHDDIGQRLALLAVELDQLHLEPPESPELLDRMGELQQQAS